MVRLISSSSICLCENDWGLQTAEEQVAGYGGFQCGADLDASASAGIGDHRSVVVLADLVELRDCATGLQANLTRQRAEDSHARLLGGDIAFQANRHSGNRCGVADGENAGSVFDQV